jgi:ATP-dependent Clp protease ATP-binding subunit ClpC
MSEYFNRQALEVVDNAQAESQRLGHNFIGSEMLLLGVLAQSNSFVAAHLNTKGLDLETGRYHVESIIGKGNKRKNNLEFTYGSKVVLAFAVNESTRLGQQLVSPEHVILSLIEFGKGVGVRVLELTKIDIADLKEQLDRHLSSF